MKNGVVEVAEEMAAVELSPTGATVCVGHFACECPNGDGGCDDMMTWRSGLWQGL